MRHHLPIENSSSMSNVSHCFPDPNSVLSLTTRHSFYSEGQMPGPSFPSNGKQSRGWLTGPLPGKVESVNLQLGNLHHTCSLVIMALIYGQQAMKEGGSESPAPPTPRSAVLPALWSLGHGDNMEARSTLSWESTKCLFWNLKGLQV